MAGAGRVRPIGRRRRVRWAVPAAALAALAGAAPASAASGTDPALAALRDRDAYVSPIVAGAHAADWERRLAATAERMDDAERPVKLAVVAGPVGSPSLGVYVRRLYGALRFGGTLVITTRGRALATAGTRSTAAMTRSLRAARAGQVADPVARLARAADAAAPPAPDPDEQGRRALIGLLVLAVLGGAWAAAIGAGHQGKRARREMTEARGRARVCADALRAHTMALARRADLTPDARAHVDQALGVYAEAVSSLPEMRRTEDIAAFAPRIRAALDDIASTTAAATGEPRRDDPFAGLCGIDPAHGPAVVTPAGGRPLCEACRDAAAGGETLTPRMLFEGGRAVPFDQATYGPVLRPERTA